MKFNIGDYKEIMEMKTTCTENIIKAYIKRCDQLTDIINREVSIEYMSRLQLNWQIVFCY